MVRVARSIATALAAAAVLLPPAAGTAAASPQGRAARQASALVTPRRIDVRLELHPDVPVALIECALTFVPQERIDSVTLSLRSDVNLDAVEDTDGVPLVYRRRRSSVQVMTPPLESGAETTWTFRYRARFDATLEESGQMLLTTPWYPHFLVQRTPGEFQRFVPMAMSVTATLPPPWVLVSAGTDSQHHNDDGTFTYTWRDSVPSTQIPLAVAPFARREERTEMGTLRGFFPPEYASLIDTYVDYMGEAAAFFSERIGPLNRRSWNLVAMNLPENISGVTYPGVTFLEAENLDPDAAFPYRVLAHEIAHHWWNHFIEIPRPRDAWLREGLPTYSALLFLESQYGNQMMRLELERSRRVALAVDTDEALDMGFEMSTQEAIYAFNYHKATMVLHMLREVIGLDGFMQLCRELHDYRKDVTTEVFQRLAEEVYGDDLSWFFAAWLHSPDVPSFDVRYGYRQAGNASRYELYGTITQRDANIRYPVRLRIPLEAAPPLETTVWVEPGTAEFRIVLPSPPRDLLFDPDGDLLYREASVEPIVAGGGG
ncbi:MAG: M1 family aminopeptidase [Acidobacteriota bacterium]